MFLLIGVKESTMVNRVFVCLNITILLFIIIAGATKANANNWHISISEVMLFKNI